MRKVILSVGVFSFCLLASVGVMAETPAVTVDSQAPATALTVPSKNAPNASMAPMTELLLFDDIVMETATKNKKKISEVPGSVTIISGEEIKQRGVLTLDELLMNTVGALYYQSGNGSAVWFRGIYNGDNTKILILQNGRKMNDPDLGAVYNNFDIPLDNIKQIEIIRGPGSALYGANAFAGVINIITQEGKDLKGVKAMVSAGRKPGDPELSQSCNLTYGDVLGDYDLTLTTRYLRQLMVDSVNVNTPNELAEGNNVHLALKKKSLTLYTGYEKIDLPVAGTFSTPQPQDRRFNERVYLDVKHSWELNDLSKLSIRLSDTYQNRFKMLRWNMDLTGYSRTKINSVADIGDYRYRDRIALIQRGGRILR